MVDANEINVSCGSRRLDDISCALLTDVRAREAEIGTVLDVATPSGRSKYKKEDSKVATAFAAFIACLLYYVPPRRAGALSDDDNARLPSV